MNAKGMVRMNLLTSKSRKEHIEPWETTKAFYAGECVLCIRELTLTTRRIYIFFFPLNSLT